MRRSALCLGLAAVLVAGCFDSSATLRNPHTGEQSACRSEMVGLNPYAQSEACTAAKVAAGWVPEGYGR